MPFYDHSAALALLTHVPECCVWLGVYNCCNWCKLAGVTTLLVSLDNNANIQDRVQ